MANTQSAQKRIRSNARKAKVNTTRTSRVRSAVRSARETLATKDAPKSKEAIMKAVSELDKAAARGVIHPNNASRRKGRLIKKLAALEAKK
ncbi:MAG: 30S ribosomal protein S20 [Chloroflexi bacterium]|nr:30S ribosomal protein S20 [Chloroflexota bacterium]